MQDFVDADMRNRLSIYIHAQKVGESIYVHAMCAGIFELLCERELTA